MENKATPNHNKASVKLFKKFICKKKKFTYTIHGDVYTFVVKTATLVGSPYYKDTLKLTINVVSRSGYQYRNGERVPFNVSFAPSNVRHINRRLRVSLGYILRSDLMMFSLDYPNVYLSDDIKIVWG